MLRSTSEGSGSDLRELWRLVASHPRLLLLAVLGVTIDVATNNALPFIYMEMFDDALLAGDGGYVVLLMACVGLAIALQFGGWLLRAAGVSRLATRVARDIQRQMFDHFQGVPALSSGRASTAADLTLFTEPVALVESFLLTSGPRMVFGVLLAGVGIVLMFAVQWVLALVTLAAFPLTLVGSRVLGRRLMRAADDRHHERHRLTAALHDGITLQLVIQAFSLQAFWHARVVERGARAACAGTRLGRLQILSQSMTVISVAVLLAVVICGGAVLALRGAISVATLIGFFALLINVAAGMRHVAESLPDWSRAGESLRRINNFLGSTPVNAAASPCRALGPLIGSLRLDDVTFCHEGQSEPAVHGVSLCIERGERVAIVGASGSGKSTIVGLILGFHAPQRGFVTWNGAVVEGATIGALRDRIGVVFQDTSLFDMSVRDNIRLGKLDANEAEIVAAALAAGIHDTIAELPEGYDTPVGERGQRLSVGQRQRVAIARALIRQPDILLLDEATSALDPQTAAAVQDTLQRLGSEKTIIQITHRLTDAASFQHIFVMQGGRVVEEGCHDSLVASRGIYARLGGFAARGAEL